MLRSEAASVLLVSQLMAAGQVVLTRQAAVILGILLRKPDPTASLTPAQVQLCTRLLRLRDDCVRQLLVVANLRDPEGAAHSDLTAVTSEFICIDGLMGSSQLAAMACLVELAGVPAAWLSLGSEQVLRLCYESALISEPWSPDRSKLIVLVSMVDMVKALPPYTAIKVLAGCYGAHQALQEPISRVLNCFRPGGEEAAHWQPHAATVWSAFGPKLEIAAPDGTQLHCRDMNTILGVCQEHPTDGIGVRPVDRFKTTAELMTRLLPLLTKEDYTRPDLLAVFAAAMNVALKSYGRFEAVTNILESPDTAGLFDTLKVIMTSPSAVEVLVTPRSMKAIASLVLVLANKLGPPSISGAGGFQNRRTPAAFGDHERPLAAIVSTAAFMGSAARELQLPPETLRLLNDRTVARWMTSILEQADEDLEHFVQTSKLLQACCRFLSTVHKDSWELYSPQQGERRLHPIALCVEFIQQYMDVVGDAKLICGTSGGPKPVLAKFAAMLEAVVFLVEAWRGKDPDIDRMLCSSPTCSLPGTVLILLCKEPVNLVPLKPAIRQKARSLGLELMEQQEASAREAAEALLAEEQERSTQQAAKAVKAAMKKQRKQAKAAGKAPPPPEQASAASGIGTLHAAVVLEHDASCGRDMSGASGATAARTHYAIGSQDAAVGPQQEAPVEQRDPSPSRADGRVAGVASVDLDDLCCPITMEMYRDPVIAADGHTYERLSIEEWLADNDTSPLTGATLEHKILIPNFALNRLVHSHLARR
ncbi:hypothetical protein WJX72_004913 [[Myrmecia] bisecta]|uniref:U-box domain-containing protein n=1 Tax=[Myrmecia] bisecta TaxID=41462 RepID=A0AAW1R5K9_9CHLO